MNLLSLTAHSPVSPLHQIKTACPYIFGIYTSVLIFNEDVVASKKNLTLYYDNSRDFLRLSDRPIAF